MQTNILSPQIIKLDQIQKTLTDIDLFTAITEGFIAYSKGEAVIPPVGELLFDDPPGDVHIKYGYIHTQPYYVIKIASGFYNNPAIGLPSSQGLNLLFDKNTGVLKAVLLDEGYLTDVRTAIAGAVASKSLSNPAVQKIGIVGAGTQARLQLEYHRKLFPLEEAFIWNRNFDNAQKLAEKYTNGAFKVTALKSLESLCGNASIIVTTTPSSSALIKNEWIQPGTHITAVGSDTAHKIELETKLLGRADKVIVDSLSQSKSRGEVFRAVENGDLNRSDVIELGQVLNDRSLGRISTDQITIADLTGVAVQDLMISVAVFEKLSASI